MPGTDVVAVAGAILERTSALVAWSSDDDADQTSPARSADAPGASPGDQADQHAADDLQHEDRDDRAQVERADRRDEAPEDRAGTARTRRAGSRAPRSTSAQYGIAPAEREEQRAEDVGDDQQRVDVDAARRRSRRSSLRGRWRARRSCALRIASSASRERGAHAAALERVEAARGRAARRGDLAAHRAACRSPRGAAARRCRPSSATTSAAACRAGSPRRTPASTCASATSA